MRALQLTLANVSYLEVELIRIARRWKIVGSVITIYLEVLRYCSRMVGRSARRSSLHAQQDLVLIQLGHRAEE